MAPRELSPGRTLRVLGFGDSTIDRFYGRDLDYPGGNCVNFAVFARRLGATSAYAGAIGDDDAGRAIVDALHAEGVETAHVVQRKGRTGVAYLNVVDGDRVFLGFDGGMGMEQPLRLDESAGLREYVASFDAVHSSVYSKIEADLAAVAESSVLSYDFSSEPEFRTREYLELLCPHVDVALFSCSDMSERDTIEFLQSAVRRGARVALGTRGSAGAISVSDGIVVQRPARPIADPSTIVDTMGCGDAFFTRYLLSLLESGLTGSTAVDEHAHARALSLAADFAYDQCFTDGAWGHGEPFDPLTAGALDARESSR